MKILKIAAYTLGGLIALLGIVLLAVVLFVDPNDYRDEIASRVETQTGRKLTLGELKLSVFPWLALQTGASSLSDAPGFGTEPFVAVTQARVSVRLLPLLAGKLEVGQVLLEGARIHLITNAQGQNNWDSLGKQQDETAKDESGNSTSTLPTIAGIEIKDAAISIDNEQDASHQRVNKFNLTTGRFASGAPFDLKTDFELQQDSSTIQVKLQSSVMADLQQNLYRLTKPEIDLTLNGPTYGDKGIPVSIRVASMTADVGHKVHDLQGFTLTTRWQGEGYPAEGVPVMLQAQSLQADLGKQTLNLQALQADIAGAKLTGSLSGTSILDAPKLSGPLQLATLSPREWLPKLGIILPKTRDAQTFKKLSFAGEVLLSKTSAEVRNIALMLDDTQAKGSLGIADFASKALRFDLNVDRLNADRYLPPPEPASATSASHDASPPTELPVTMLRNLNARGQLSVGEAIFSGITFTRLKLGVNAEGGKVRFYPSEASMYGGQYRGDINIDATGKVARVGLDEHISNVSFGPLFKDFFKTTRVSGKGTANLKVSGAGRTTDDVMRSLNGVVDFNVADGALEGADLVYELQRARALLKKQAIPERTGASRTAFSALQGSGTMANGVLTNKDLRVVMPLLKLNGQGSVNIPEKTLDYQLVASVLRMPATSGGAPLEDLVDAQIPVKITGKLNDPKVRPDVEGYLKNEVKQRVDKEREKVEEKVKAKLGDKLKDLLGR